MVTAMQLHQPTQFMLQGDSTTVFAWTANTTPLLHGIEQIRFPFKSFMDASGVNEVFKTSTIIMCLGAFLTVGYVLTSQAEFKSTWDANLRPNQLRTLFWV